MSNQIPGSLSYGGKFVMAAMEGRRLNDFIVEMDVPNIIKVPTAEQQKWKPLTKAVKTKIQNLLKEVLRDTISEVTEREDKETLRDLVNCIRMGSESIRAPRTRKTTKNSIKSSGDLSSIKEVTCELEKTLAALSRRNKKCIRELTNIDEELDTVNIHMSQLHPSLRQNASCLNIPALPVNVNWN